MIDAAKCELDCLLDDIELAHPRSLDDDESEIRAQDVSPDKYVGNVESEIRAQIRKINALEWGKVRREARDPASVLDFVHLTRRAGSWSSTGGR